MKLTVFGATGGIGREIVRQALATGHEVTAVVRDPARLTVRGDALEVFRADLRDPEAVRPAVAGREAVLSGLGARTRGDAGIAAELTRTVLAAMAAEGVRRLVVVSGAPVGPRPTGAPEPFVDRAMISLVKAFLRDVYADLAAMERALAESATDWTSVRPPKLTDKPLTGVYRTVVGGTPRRGRTIGRPDVAHAMLTALSDPATVRRGVGVAY
ncbi:NADH-flavin reductase [Streptomyces sulfonofaciens]|uniref:NADH-flavin reductase n=1 Tax=Streptomyces sulfonofaciens TaxID=68272 RepID=A0A919L024_9ACTN|nr:SDR family oxidoreductase [Streptomyces sulfonofaciens]GHH78414.1 NADH-flavin reductase [Streptomyces sulfonofaciens]